MISVSGFGVAVISNGREVEPVIRDGAYYIPVKNGDHYKIKLSNKHEYRCNADVSIDGESIGTFRLYSYQTWTIERPGDVSKKFTFYSETSRTARRSGVIEGKEENGLIRVQFTPEKRRRIYAKTSPEYKMKGVRLSPSSLPQADESFPESSQQSYRGAMFSRSGSPQLLMASSPGSSLNESVTRSLDTTPSMSQYKSGATVLQGKSNQSFGDAERIDLDYDNMVEIILRLVVKETDVSRYPERVD